MTPRVFRDQSAADMTEMMAHRREFNLRQSHQSKVSEIVGKLDDPTDKKRTPRNRD